MKKTIIDLFESSVEKYGKKTFLLEKRHHAFQPTTYAETREQALEVGAGLASLGIRPKDKVAILAEGSNGWIISELGIFYAGAISVPLSVKLEESNDLLFRLRHAEVKALFVSKQQLPKIRRIRTELPELEQIIVLGHIPLESGETAYGMLKRLGRDYLAGHKEEFLKIGQAIRNDDYATITYTSGTTADPKGVVLTHRNYTANVEQSLSRIDIPSSYRTLIILPLDHCFAHVVGFYIMIACGASVATVQIGATPMETLKNIPQNIREVKPNFLLSVPALAKNFRKTSKLRFGPKDLSLNGCSTSRSARPISTIRTATTRARAGGSCWHPSWDFSTSCCSARCGRHSAAAWSFSSGAAHCSIRSCNAFSMPSGSRCSRDTDFRKLHPSFRPIRPSTTGTSSDRRARFSNRST